MLSNFFIIIVIFLILKAQVVNNPNGIEIRNLNELTEELDKLSVDIVSSVAGTKKTTRTGPKHNFQSSSVVLGATSSDMATGTGANGSSKMKMFLFNSKATKSMNAINTVNTSNRINANPKTLIAENIDLDAIDTINENASHGAKRGSNESIVLDTTSRF